MTKTKCRLTEKNMANKKFSKSENAIFIAYYKLKDFPTARRIAKKAKISRSTFYRHHDQPQNIPRDYEDYLFKLYQKRIKKFLEKEDIYLRTLLLRTLVFISSHQRIFRALFIHKQEEFIKKIFRCLKNRILAEWHLAGDLNEFYYVYENEIIGVIEAWDKQNFTNHSLSSTLNNLTHLTNTAPRRLTFLIKTKDSE